MRKFSPFIAAVTGAAILTLAAYVQAFSGHGGCLPGRHAEIGKDQPLVGVQKLFIAQRPASRLDGESRTWHRQSSDKQRQPP